ncbi:hypothetical protein JHK87_049136 [Glycine soja]|nr:hypothetical protein JHK87_049136 [Glycine soja]
MRKSLKHYIWKVKPNPPRRENDDLEDYNKPDEISDQNNGAEKIDKEKRRKGSAGSSRKSYSESELESDSQSKSEEEECRWRKSKKN